MGLGGGRTGLNLRRGAAAGGESSLAPRSCQSEAASRAGGDLCGGAAVGAPTTAGERPATVEARHDAPFERLVRPAGSEGFPRF